LAHWEPHELEWLDACPVCNSRNSVLHQGLQDYILMAAGGQWRLMSCSACSCAFLNLRPTATTIGRAFRNAIKGEAPGLVRIRPKQAGQSLILDVGCGSGLSLLRAPATPAGA
jgi:hypothetical protein